MVEMYPVDPGSQVPSMSDSVEATETKFGF